MEDIRIQKGAKVLVDLAEVKKGENVLVLSDFNTYKVGMRIVSEVYQVGAYPIFMAVPPLKVHGAPYPEVVTEIAKQVDVIIAPMTTNLAHTPTRHEVQKKGIRVVIFPEATEELLSSDAFDADFYALRPKVEKLADFFTKASKARVTSPKGTDITMSIEGRKGRALHGFAQKNEISPGPGIEASIAPVEGTAEGKIVVDVSIPGLGLVKEPVEIIVSGGFAREIKGGLEAKQFRELLESKKDPNIYNIGELGVGMNPACKPRGNMLEDEATLGIIHIALGTSVTGGKVRAAGHYDTLLSHGTLELDGVAVVKDGELAF